MCGVQTEAMTFRRSPLIALAFKAVRDLKLDLAHPLVNEIRQAHSKIRQIDRWRSAREEICQILPTNVSAKNFCDKNGTLTLSGTLVDKKKLTELLSKICRDILPWRTGPYDLFGELIDSEWRSQLKWNRLKIALPKLNGLTVADVGASNGYFVYQMALDGASFVVGIDPIDRCWLQFTLLQSLIQHEAVAFLPLALSHLTLMPQTFDVIVCMGVIYHQRDPIEALRTLRSALRPGGRLIIESLIVPVDGPYLLRPQKRYAKMRNAWFIPSLESLQTMLTEAGFKEIEGRSFGPITKEEQRKTPLAPYESLSDFLDPEDSSKTIEGYPAPHSGIVWGNMT